MGHGDCELAASVVVVGSLSVMANMFVLARWIISRRRISREFDNYLGESMIAMAAANRLAASEDVDIELTDR